MGQRQKQHMGRSEGDESTLPGRDVAGDDEQALDAKAIRRDGPADETGEKPSTGKGGALDAE